jgi:hypothetical protein
MKKEPFDNYLYFLQKIITSIQTKFLDGGYDFIVNHSIPPAAFKNHLYLSLCSSSKV